MLTRWDHNWRILRIFVTRTEAVAHAANRVNQCKVATPVDFAAQVANIHVYDVRLVEKIKVPDAEIRLAKIILQELRANNQTSPN